MLPHGMVKLILRFFRFKQLFHAADEGMCNRN